MAYTTINKSTDYFNTKLYTGTGSGQNITVGFQPDWSWIKIRNIADSHVLVDSVRGATKFLQSNNGSAETTSSSFVQAFTSDGLTLGGNQGTSSSSNTYASWNWLASNTTASNTDGSITSTVSANTTAGFSIVSWTGTGANGTIGHGLNSAPQVVIVKDRSAGFGWLFGHNSLGSWTKNLKLNETIAFETITSTFNSTAPTSSVFSIGSSGANNGSGNSLIAYCFAEKQGYSKFGSYTGNGNADGTFVYTGFKPAFLIIKRYDSTNNWHMYNNKVNPFNETDRPLKADTSESEATIFGGNELDFLSNGFKLRDTINGTNGSGASYIYMAFAEAPLVGTNNVPCTAR